MLLAVLTAASMLVVAPTAHAQSDTTPQVAARVATPGLQNLSVTGSGFTPGLALFVFPCPSIAEVDQFDVDECDFSELTP